MAGNARFHNKWHRRGHHSIASEGYPDSATDPIASPDEPFIGPFVLQGNLSAGGDVAFDSNLFIRGDLTILGSLTALGDTTVLETHVTATSALSVINHGSEPALTVIQYGDNPVARFIADDGVAFVIEDNGNIGINTSDLEPGVGLTIGTTLSSSYPLSANASYGTFHSFAGSVSEGDSKALGNFAHAEGTASFAYGTGSHAEGSGNTANGVASHVQGIGNVANEDAAHAEGGNNVASGYAAHAEGSYNTASGNSSHAEGYNNQATGIASHAHGTGNIVHAAAGSAQGSNNLIEASGASSSAIGISNTISGINSLAQGEDNLIDAAVRNGIAIGKNNVIRGNNSVAIGKNNRTIGKESIALGIGARAGHDKSIVYSATDSNYYQSNSFGDHTFNVFASSGIVLYDSTTIGDPASATFFAITTAGFVGIGTEDPYDKLTVAGNISAQGSLSAFAAADTWHKLGGSLQGGFNTDTYVDNNTLVWNTHPDKTFSSTSTNQIALNTEWMVVSARRIEYDYNVNIITSGTTTSSSLNKFSRLSASQLYGVNNYAGGRSGSATGRFNLVDGVNNIVCGSDNTVRGTYNSATGDQSLAVGKNNVVAFNQSHVEGINNVVGLPRTITSWTTAANTFYIAGNYTGTSSTFNFPAINQKIYVHQRGTSRTTNLTRTSFTVLTTFQAERAIVTVESLSALGFDNPTGDAPMGINAGYFIALPTALFNSTSNLVGAHAEGVQNLAGGTAAHAEGYNNISFATGSHVEGINSIAGGIAAHAEGNATKAGVYMAHISAFDFAARTFYFDNTSPLSAVNSPHELWNIVTPGTIFYINDGANFSTTTGRRNYTTVQILSTDPALATITAVSAVNVSFIWTLPSVNVYAWIPAGATSTHAKGLYTIASGSYSEASGYGSYALGNNSVARGYRSIALHNNTYVWADGSNQTSNIPVPSTRTNQYVVSAGGGVYFPGNLGIGTDDNSRALTVLGVISGQNPQVAFNRGIATGNYSFAEGAYSVASGDTSHAEGANTVASGDYSHAEGISTAATGDYSHAEGNSTVASGKRSHAEGTFTMASGIASHAQNNGTAATGARSHAEGVYTATGRRNAFAYYSSATKTFTFAAAVSANFANVAAGDLLRGYEVDWLEDMFDIVVASRDTSTGQISARYDAIGADSVNGYLIDDAGSAGHAEGDYTTAAGAASHAEGTQTVASGNYSHAQGEGAQAIGTAAHAQGINTYALGQGSHAEGLNTVVLGDYSHAEGMNTVVYGDGSHAEGFNTIALGNQAHAAGRYVCAAHSRSWAWKGAVTTETEVISTTRTGQFMVSAAGGMYIPGNVGIGTDANSEALTVTGNIAVVNGNIAVDGKLTVDGNSILGNASTDQTIINAFAIANASRNFVVGANTFTIGMSSTEAIASNKNLFVYDGVNFSSQPYRTVFSDGGNFRTVTDPTMILGTNSDQHLRFRAGGATDSEIRMTILSSGEVGIGTSLTQTAAANLTVAGTISAAGGLSAANVSLRSANVITPASVVDNGQFLILNINGTNKAIRLWDYTT